MTFPKDYLGKIWYSKSLSWQPLFNKRFFFRILNFPLLIKKHYFFEVNFTFLDQFYVTLLFLISSWPILVLFGSFGKIKKSKMADPRWPPFENKTLLWRHMTSSVYVADLNGNIFGRTICPLSFVVIALIFSKLRSGGGIRPLPGPTRPKKARSE